MEKEKYLIDRNALSDKFKRSFARSIGEARAAYRSAWEETLDAPIVDAVEVVHGRWNPYKISNAFTHSCSVCHCDVNDKTPYCPYCGANMCGGNENV